jgi:hypothetical protein
MPYFKYRPVVIAKKSGVENHLPDSMNSEKLKEIKLLIDDGEALQYWRSGAARTKEESRKIYYNKERR